MKRYFPLIASFLLFATPFIPTPIIASESELIAQDIPSELKKYAKSISVKISTTDSNASGAIIGQQDNNYLVLTSNHVIRGDSNLTIQTSDGITHQAILVSNFESDDDVALLQFSSEQTYEIINIGTTLPKVPQTIYALGYLAETREFVIQPGRIEKIPNQSLKEGYRIGYSSNIVSGMSGGAIVNSEGQLIGINGIGAFPILNTAYVYQDGTKPSSEEIEQLRQLSWGIPIHSLLTQLNPEIITAYNLPLPELPETAINIKNTKLTGWLADLETKAQQITVRIDNIYDEKDQGSGVIIAKEGDTYTVLTANHVICSEDCLGNYKMLAPDGKEYTLNNSTFKGQEGVDLAVFQFTSDQNYQVAELADYSIRDYDAIFVAGYPKWSQKTQESNLLFSLGYGLSQEQGLSDLWDNTIKADVSSSRVSVAGGYGLVYTNITYGGMSGGAVLDKDGRVIGIHGLTEGDEDENTRKKLLAGYSLGIPIKTFLSLRERFALNTQNLQLQHNQTTKLSQKEKDMLEAVVLNVEISQGNAKPTQLLQIASKLLKLRRNREALETLDQAIFFIEQSSAQGDLYLALLGKGSILWELGEYQEALENFNKSIGVNPNFETSFYNKAWLLMDLEQFEEALVAINKALELQDNNPNYYSIKGQILSGLEQYAEAEPAYNKAIQLSPRADLYNGRGLIHYELQQWEKAEADLTQAIKTNPTYANAYINRGYLYDGQRQPELAIADFTQAIEINPESALAYLNRGKTYSEQEEWKLAFVDYNQAISLDPNLALAYLNRGYLYQQQQQWDQALADYEQAIYLEPDLALSYSNRGYLYQQQQQWDQALADYEQAIALDAPESALAYINRGVFYINQQQDWNKALADFNQAIAIFSKLNLPSSYNKQLALAYNNRGVSYSGLQQWNQALADFNRAIDLDPNLPLAHFGRGVFYHQRKNYTVALSNYYQALYLDKNFFYSIHNMGLINYEMDNLDKARQLFQQVINIDSNLAESQFALAVVLFTQGKTEQAFPLADKALKSDKKYADIEFLEKNLWGDKIISDTEKLLEALN